MVESSCRFCGLVVHPNDDVAVDVADAHASCVDARLAGPTRPWWRRAISNLGMNLAEARGGRGAR